MRIIDARTRDLVLRIEAAKQFGPALDSLVRELVQRLTVACSRPAVVEKYRNYDTSQPLMVRMPTDAEGYMVSFDPLEDEDGFYECWRKYGIVVSKQVISERRRTQTISRVHDIVRKLSDGTCSLQHADTWHNMPVDANAEPILTRGFFEVYHDDALAQLRQAIRVYLHFVLIWGRPDLWTTFDRLGVKLPGHKESKALPLHVDQNPNVHPGFKTVQGVLAITDCPSDRGTFVGVPGSREIFHMYQRMAKNAGEYVELDLGDPRAMPVADRAQICPLRGGDLISWDSRTTHANSANTSQYMRMVAYIAAGPALPNVPEIVEHRNNAFRTGVGLNVREALMHASKKKRYTNPDALQRVRTAEQLSLLGRLLYGQDQYSDVTTAASS